MSTDARGEHVEPVWLSEQDVGVLLRAVEEMLDPDSHRAMTVETRTRLTRLSQMLSEL